MSLPPRLPRLFRWSALGLALSAPAVVLPAAPGDDGTKPVYEQGIKTADGTGKYFFGREIANFMTHEGAPWLERPEREQEERPDLLIKTLQIQPGEIIADIGCGSGYITWRLANATTDRGVVYGVEIQQEMLNLLSRNLAERKVGNVVGVLGTPQDPNLPEGVDLVVMVDTYHEFSYPLEMMEAIVRSLKPGGRVALVEYRAEDPKVPIKRLHKMTEAQVRKEMAAQDLVYVETVHTLPRQHLIIFRKRTARERR